MDTLLAIFVRVIVPVIVTVGVGYLAARLLVFDLKMLARLGLYVLVPCLTFTAMARTTLAAGEFGRIVAFTLISVPLLWGLSSVAARLLKLPAAEAGAFHISVLFTNAVNFGFPVLLLAYGPAALERGIVYAMTAQIVMQSLGVYLAARGRADFKSAMKRTWSMPGLYAMIAGILVKALAIPVPAPLFDPLKLIGDSLVPFLLLVMGMQLAAVNLRGSWKAASVATVLRLVVAAGLSFGLARGLGLTGLTRQTMILENSMPSAILGVALAQEFETAPELVTKIIFLTTLAGLFTLTLLLTLV
ncbi:MAG: AEC family transporter [Candidatus Aminicenantes bacterium]|nr:AEC family transporter [Candidatus Aminicenantes bacterium]